MKEISVLFENDHCMVLNKPSGLAVQGGEGIKVSLDSILSERYSPRPLLVHRLDRDTSGLILVAKTKEAAASFSALFAECSAKGKAQQERSLIKRYWGVCSGIPKPAQGVIRQKLEVRKKNVTLNQESETSYKLLSSTTEGELVYSLVELELGTGRMHQIRKHLANIGHPLLGDDKYGNFALNKQLKKTHALKHLLLHARQLAFPPIPNLLPSGLDVSAPPPDYFSHYLGELKK